MEKNGSFFFNSRVLYRIGTLLIIALDEGDQKGPLSNIFSISEAVPHFLNGPYEIP